jgi:hypothetical protein
MPTLCRHRRPRGQVPAGGFSASVMKVLVGLSR